MSQELIQILMRHLQKGLTLDREMRHFLESTYGVTDHQGFQELIQTSHESEAEMLYEFLFFPDLSLRLAIEPLLLETRFSPQDEGQIVKRLCAKPLATTMRFLKASPKICIELPQASLRRFAQRLRVSSHPPKELVEKIFGYADKRKGTHLLVRLRQEKLSFEKESLSFMLHLMERLSVENLEFQTLTELAVEVVGSWQKKGSFMEHMIEARNQVEAHAEKAKAFEKGLETLTMESMMMQGLTAPSHSEKALRQKLKNLDLLIRLGLGTTPYPVKPTQVNLGHVHTDEGILGVIARMKQKP